MCQNPYQGVWSDTLIGARLVAQSCLPSQGASETTLECAVTPHFWHIRPRRRWTMRQYFTPQELVDHFTLLPHEHGLLAHKSGINRLGFVVLFKYFQWAGRFPAHGQEVPSVLVQHIAATLNLPADGVLLYELEGRTARYHKEQIRQWWGF